MRSLGKLSAKGLPLTIGSAAIAVAALVTLRAQPRPPTPTVTAEPAAQIGSDAGLAHGKTMYENHCAECHGVAGRGDGPAALLLMPRPRDFSTGKYEIRSTNTGSLPTDDDLIQTVRRGVYGSTMPAWQGLLSDADIGDVVAYVKSFSPRFKSERAEAIRIGLQVPSTAESIERGQQVYDKLRCSSCHGTDGRGTGAIASDFADDANQPLNAADLTEPWTFHGGASARDVYLRFRTGMTGTPMPSFADSATDGELWDLANYVLSLARKPAWSMNGQELAALYAREAAEAKNDPVKRGRYLVDTHLCPICHSPVDENGRILPGLKMAGGQLFRINPFGDYVAGNLTSDKETGLGNWTDDQIKQVITRGVLRDGTRLLPYPMDWPSFSALVPDDLDAMVAYLRTLPPVYNRNPPPRRPFLPVYLWGKFKMLILRQDLPIEIFPGNAGTTSRPS